MNNPFEHTGDVAIELSNLCQYAWLHKKCPLHLQAASPFRVKEPVVLPARIVYSIIDILGRHDYDQKLSFHQYNEPLMDPRLFLFLEYAKKHCPGAGVEIVTNGHYLDLTLAKELEAAGVQILLVTLYGNEEDRAAMKARITAYKQQLSIHVRSLTHPWPDQLNDRLTVYSHPRHGDELCCTAPLGCVTITRDAEVALCCIDWRREHTFGNLYEGSLEEILASDDVQETYRRLSRGDRFLDICQRCATARSGRRNIVGSGNGI